MTIPKYLWFFVAALPLFAADVPSLYLVGDSITRTGTGNGDVGPWGMGSELIPLFDASKVYVLNEALEGDRAAASGKRARGARF